MLKQNDIIYIIVYYLEVIKLKVSRLLLQGENATLTAVM